MFSGQILLGYEPGEPGGAKEGQLHEQLIRRQPSLLVHAGQLRSKAHLLSTEHQAILRLIHAKNRYESIEQKECSNLRIVNIELYTKQIKIFNSYLSPNLEPNMKHLSPQKPYTVTL